MRHPFLLVAFCLVVSCAFAQTFTQINATTAAVPTQAIRGDFDNDSIPDLAVANSKTPSVTVLLMNANGTVRARRDFVVAQNPTGITAADLNHDRKLDIITSNQDPNSSRTMSVLMGNGDGTFQPAKYFYGGVKPIGITSADVDSDGHFDIITGEVGTDPNEPERPSNHIIITHGTGTGTFNRQSQYLDLGSRNWVNMSALAAGDFDGDGKVDIVMLESNDAAHLGDVFLMRNIGEANGFTNFEQLLVGNVNEPTEFAVDDVNQDGRSDVIVTYNQCRIWEEGCEDFAIHVGYFQSKADGTFPFIPVGLWPGDEALARFHGPSAGDINRDGLKDVVVTTRLVGDATSSVIVFLQQSNGTFTNSTGLPVYKLFRTTLGEDQDMVSGDTLTADFNRDSRLDLVATGADAKVAFLLNTFGVRTCAPYFENRRVKICLPLFSTFTSPVQVLANTHDTIPVEAMKIYVDGVQKFFTRDDFLSARITLPVGDHRMTVKAWDKLGAFSQSINFTVSNGCVISGIDRTVRLCSPIAGSTVASPVRIQAVLSSAGTVFAGKVYVDGETKLTTEYGSRQVDVTVPMSPGTHRITIRGWDAAGAYSTSFSVNVAALTSQ